MRITRSVILCLAMSIWAGMGLAQEAVPATGSEETVAEPAPRVVAPVVAPTAYQPDVELRLGTIDVVSTRERVANVERTVGTIMPSVQPREALPAEQARWGNLTHVTGATYSSAVRIDQKDFERKTALDLTDALKSEPGVRINYTGRRANEGTISIRGSNRLQVGMYIDDVPTGTSYRNEWDAKNYLLYSLDSIEVSKGYSSPLLATNNGLAGVVNLRTAKPTEKIEATVKYMNFFDRDFDDQGRMAAASFGTKQEKFYLKVTGIFNEQDYFKLPSGFKPGLYEDGGRRDNYNSRNRSINLIAGFTPNDRVDIMFGVMRQLYKKGYMVNAAEDGCGLNLGNNNERYVFDFPDYETTRYYTNANFQLTDKLNMKAVAYYDEHLDRSVTIDSRTGRPVSGTPSGFNVSAYDQYSYGGHLRFDYIFNDQHQISASGGYRRQSHKTVADYGKSQMPPNLNGLVTDKNVEDYLDFGGEYTFRPIEPLAFVLGGSYSWVKPNELLRTPNVATAPGVYEDYKHGMLADSNHLTTWQAGVYYDLTENHQIYTTFAKKSRFATMRERYNVRNMTNSVYVKPEHATHFEIGYRGVIDDWLQIGAGAYYSKIKDYIRQNGRNDPFENMGDCEMYGFEFNGEAVFTDWLRVGANLNLVKWTTHSDDPAIGRANKHMTNLPNISSTIYAVYQPIEKISIIPQVDMTGHFYRESQAALNDYSKSPGFVTADLKVVYDVNDHFTIEAGARNIFDKEYAYSAYYPQQGRNFFLGITATW